MQALKLLGAGTTALSGAGAGLRAAATAIGADDRQGAHDALKDLRDTRDRLADIPTARDCSRRAAQAVARSPVDRR